ncbi:MAG: hypothetical protein IKM97_05580 [Clostridia bacterium]|nr:hypothetical protein [Clostridia bacterium]
MKAVFPTKGVIIVTKNNVRVLHDFYKEILINSKLFNIYQNSSFQLQVKNLNYLPQNSNIILSQAHLLTLQQLQQIVAKQLQENQKNNSNDNSRNSNSTIRAEEPDFTDEPLDDNFIKNNPFFQTLTYTDNNKNSSN